MKKYLVLFFLLVFTSIVSSQEVYNTELCKKIFRENEIKTMNGFLKNFIGTTNFTCTNEEMFLSSFSDNKLVFQIIWGDSNEQVINVYFLLNKVHQIFDEIPRNKNLINQYIEIVKHAKTFVINDENRFNKKDDVIVCFNFLYDKKNDVITKPVEFPEPIKIYDLVTSKVYSLGFKDIDLNNKSSIIFDEIHLMKDLQIIEIINNILNE